MQLRIRSITYLAEDINGYELVDPNGHDLPRFTAGSHIGVRLGEAVWRDYSLWNDPAERRRYCIAVLREKLGEASRRLHDQVRVGDTVEVSPPRNHFPLAEDAERHLLLAGGIGVTPVLAVIAELEPRRRRHECRTTGRSGSGWRGVASNTPCRRARASSMCCAGPGSTPARPASLAIAALA